MLAPGTRIGSRYTIENLLGQGGMSNLYLARDAQAGGAVRVIKEMTARYADPNEQRMAEELFMREAQLLFTLNHPNIPKVWDKFTFQGKYYLNMDYVQGEDLGKLITQANKPLPEKDVANWGHQMSTVLYYLHRQNPPIVFRDVKPSNIMIAGDQVKLIDFGIARLFTPAKKGDTMRIGSPGYAPPEQYSGQTDPRSDIYALGVTLHHALTGHDPTVSQTPFLIPSAKSLNPALSDEMVNIITRSTQLDPEKRYPSMIEMKRDLQVVLRKHGVNVGASMPLQPLTAAAVTSGPAATATATPTPPIPTPSVTPSAPVVAPIPIPVGATSQTSKPASTQPGRRGRWGAMAFVAASLAGTVYMAMFGANHLTVPAGWKDSLNTVLSTPTLPKDPAEAASSLYQKGGPLPVVLELSQKALEEHPGEPEPRIVYQNALALASELPITRWAVAVPNNSARADVLRGLAVAQRVANDRGGIEQSLIVLEIGSYENQNFATAYKDALQGRWGRPQSPDLKGVLVFAEQAFPWSELLAGSSVPTFVVGPVSGAVPSGLQALTIPQKSPTELFKSALGVDPAKIVWLAQKTPKLEGTSQAGLDAKLAVLLKEKSIKVIVIDPDQAKAVAELKLAGDVRIVMIGERVDSLPAPADLAGLKLTALVPGSSYSASELQSGFFRLGSLTFSDWKPSPQSAGGSAYDGLLWASQAGAGKWTGVSLKVDASGKLTPAPWSVAEVRGDQWVVTRNVE